MPLTVSGRRRPAVPCHTRPHGEVPGRVRKQRWQRRVWPGAFSVVSAGREQNQGKQALTGELA